MTTEYAKCTTLDEMKEVMVSLKTIYKDLTPENKKFYSKLKNNVVDEVAVEEVKKDIEEVEVDTAEMEAKREEAKKAAAPDVAPDKYLHIRNGIFSQLFKKIPNGIFRAKMNQIMDLECTTLVALKSQMEVLISTATEGDDKMIIRKYLNEIDNA